MQGQIKYSKFELTINPVDVIVLPSYKGSTLRGGFGFAFKKIVCALKNTECEKCLLKEKCVYSYVFETPPPSDTKIMRKYSTAPHPFVIEPPSERKRAYKPGDEITFGLTLIGKALDYLPYFIYTFDELGKIGIGKGRGKYELKSVKIIPSNPCLPDRQAPLPKGGRGDFQEEISETIYDSATKTLKTFQHDVLDLAPLFHHSHSSLASQYSYLSLSFLTPTRIIYSGHLILDLEFHILIRQLIRRMSLLYYFHCDGDPSEWDFKGIIEKAKEVRMKKQDLRWYDWERYSARQDTRMKMGGFVGSITFEGNIEPFMPLIRAGEVLHVGKGTAFGLGKYEISW